MFRTINALAIAVSLSLLVVVQAQAQNTTFNLSTGPSGTLTSHSVTQDGVTLLIDNPNGDNTDVYTRSFAFYGGGLFLDGGYSPNLDFTFDHNVQLVSYVIANTEGDGNSTTFNLTQGSLESLNNSNSALGTFAFTNVNDSFAGTVPIALQSGDNDAEGYSISALTVNAGEFVPEPSTLILSLVGLALLPLWRRNLRRYSS